MLLTEESSHLASLFAQQLESRNLSNIIFCAENRFDSTDNHERVSLTAYFIEHVFSIEVTRFELTENYVIFIKYHHIKEHFHKGKIISYPKPQYRTEKRRISIDQFKEVTIPRFPSLSSIYEINEDIVKAIVDSCEIDVASADGSRY